MNEAYFLERTCAALYVFTDVDQSSKNIRSLAHLLDHSTRFAFFHFEIFTIIFVIAKTQSWPYEIQFEGRMV